jgi:hypothetical protein
MIHLTKDRNAAPSGRRFAFLSTPISLFYTSPGTKGDDAALPLQQSRTGRRRIGKENMNNVIYIVGLVVVVLAILSFFGLR